MADLKQFLLADTAEGLTEAEIIEWRVQPGDDVTVNQIVVEIETAKAAVELPIPWAGRVTELLAEPGQTVEVGSPILTIDLEPSGASGSGADGASADVEAQAQVSASAGTPETAEVAADEPEMKVLVGYGSKPTSARRRARKFSAPQPPPSSGGRPHIESIAASQHNGAASKSVDNAAAGGQTAPPQRPPKRPLAKPPVRKMAKDAGIDLATLTGTGPDGVITRADVESAITDASQTSTAAAQPTVTNGAPAPSPAAATARGERRIPIKGVRRATAEAMVASAFTAPHVTEFLTVDVTPMMELRTQLKSRFPDVKITPLAFAAKAMCLAAKRTPEVNATWDADKAEIVYKDYVHLGVAAATPRGLIVPKVFDADTKDLVELAQALDELTTTARAGKTPPEQMVGGTITITNVGVFGVDTGTPIINPGESAILAFGAIRDTPWVVDGEITVRKVCQLALSFDHRLVDGQAGSQYLADVGALLADPALAMTY